MQIFYLPNIAYFAEFLKQEELVLHVNDKYSRQSLRNRTEIVGPNGKLVLSIPTQKLDLENRQYDHVKLSYAESWLKQHWRSFESAYRRSAYFEYYEDKLYPMFNKPQVEHLWEFNVELMKIVLLILKIDKPLHINKIDEAPKYQPNETFIVKPYQQVFSNKLAFVPNLSIIDLIFNLGPQSKSYLS